MTFETYGRGLDDTPDAELPDPKSVPADVQLLVQEARIGCTTGMLLCLDREQRLVYVLGHIFGVTDRVGAEQLEVSADAFRQKLARARRDLHNFMRSKCGLVNQENPCRCAKKTQGFIKAGYLDPQNLLFAKERVTRVREVAEQRSEDIDELATLTRTHFITRSLLLGDRFAEHRLGPELREHIRMPVGSVLSTRMPTRLTAWIPSTPTSERRLLSRQDNHTRASECRRTVMAVRKSDRM